MIPLGKNFCPICGNDERDITQTNKPGIDRTHRCPEKILQGIEAAHTNALRNDFDMGALHEKTYTQRIHDGFAIINQYEIEDNENYQNR